MPRRAALAAADSSISGAARRSAGRHGFDAVGGGPGLAGERPVVSPFGYRWGRLHAGIDIAVGYGTPIHAAAAGTAVLVGWVSGYGNYTCIDHGGGLATCYAHQSSYAISRAPRWGRAR